MGDSRNRLGRCPQTDDYGTGIPGQAMAEHRSTRQGNPGSDSRVSPAHRKQRDRSHSGQPCINRNFAKATPVFASEHHGRKEKIRTPHRSSLPQGKDGQDTEGKTPP